MNRELPSVGRLFILSPEQERFQKGMVELERFLQAGHPCYAYLLDDAVTATSLPEIQRLREMGLHLTTCAFAALRRKIPLNDDAVFGGLVMLADIIQRCDDFAAIDDSPIENVAGRGNSVICVADGRKAKWARQGEAWRVAAGLAATGLQVKVVCLPEIPENPPQEIKLLIGQAITSRVEIILGGEEKIEGKVIWFSEGVSGLDRFHS